MLTSYENFQTTILTAYEIRGHVRKDNPKTIIWYGYPYDQIYMKDPIFKVV